MFQPTLHTHVVQPSENTVGVPLVPHVQCGRSVLSSDEAFDQQLPPDLQVRASVHFTPVHIARRAAELLAPEAGMSVLDVGSGAGKFCLAAAQAVPSAAFVGVEYRGRLVRLARRLASQVALANVAFIHGDAFDLDWAQYDAFYLFNPFGEQLLANTFILDRTVDLDPAKFVVYVSGVRHRLSCARIGTRVVTYHGYGAPAPLGYELVHREPNGSDSLELWVKTRAISMAEAAEGDA